MSYIGKPVSGQNANPQPKGAVTIQNWLASGTDYSYGLIKTPLSKNYVDVYVQGIYQNKTEFSVTGSLLTFNSIIPAGYQIEVTIQDALPATESTNVSDIGFMNKAVITENHVVPAGYNMLSAGPVSIADGVTVEVTSDSVWSII